MANLGDKQTLGLNPLSTKLVIFLFGSKVVGTALEVALSPHGDNPNFKVIKLIISTLLLPLFFDVFVFPVQSQCLKPLSRTWKMRRLLMCKRLIGASISW